MGFEDVEESEYDLPYEPMLFFGTWGEICPSVGPRGKISLFWISLKLGGHVKHDESNKVHQDAFFKKLRHWMFGGLWLACRHETCFTHPSDEDNKV